MIMSAKPFISDPPAFGVTALHPAFGAEITGFQMARLDQPGYFDSLRALFERHSLLVLRDLALDDDQHLALSRRFGPLEVTKAGTVGTGSNLVILTNIAPDGSLLPETHRQWLEGLGNQLWHSDSSFKLVPALASLLRARVIPASGGETEFISMRAVHASLPAALQARLDAREAVHDYAHSRSLISPTLMTDAERAELPPVVQPLVRVHPESGLRSLFLGSHLARIIDMPARESDELLRELTAIATQQSFVHTHHWRAGDLVLWDNRCVMHRGRPFPPDQRRHMVRTTVAGSEPGRYLQH